MLTESLANFFYDLQYFHCLKEGLLLRFFSIMALMRHIGEQLPSIASSRATVLFALLLTVALFLALRQHRKPRLPDVPILQISNLPGQAGAAEDIAAFIRNGKDVLQIGYDRYSKHGQNYLLRSVYPNSKTITGRELLIRLQDPLATYVCRGATFHQ